MKHWEEANSIQSQADTLFADIVDIEDETELSYIHTTGAYDGAKR